MNDSQIGGKTLNRLAALLACLRPDWQEPGILDALTKATKLAACVDGCALVVASARAANDGKNRTPAVIALDGRHWHETEARPGSTAFYGPSMCVGCGEHGPTHDDCVRRRGEHRQRSQATLDAIKALPRRPVEQHVPPKVDA